VYRLRPLSTFSGGEKSSATGQEVFTHAGAKTESIRAEMGGKGKVVFALWSDGIGRYNYLTEIDRFLDPLEEDHMPCLVQEVSQPGKRSLRARQGDRG
jgi:hypothetical protein